MRSIIFTAVVTAALVSACGDSSGPSGPGPAANLTIVSGANIDGVAGQAAGTALSVRVTDSQDRPVPGTLVQFSITQGGGSLSAAAQSTDNQGIAAVNWTLGQTAGTARAQAQVQGLAPAQFNAVVRAGPAAALARVSPAPGTSAANFELADSVAIRVADSFGNPVPDATVNFAVTAGGGSTSHAARTSNAQGIASVAWQLGAAGPQSLQASSGALQTTVNAVASACTETSIAPGSVLTIGPADPRCVTLAAPAARYVITVVNTSTNSGTTNSFRLRGAGASTPNTIAAAEPAAAVRNLALRAPAARDRIEEARHRVGVHDALMRANEDVLRRLAPGRSAAMAALRGSGLAAMAPPPAVGDTVDLRIPNLSNLCSLTGSTAVRGRVVFLGQHGVMIEDITSPLAGQIDTLYTRVGQEFDTGMWQLLLDNFGDPLAMDDQTDDNDRFYMLFSPVVNNLQDGAIAGFVASSDFFPPTGAPGVACPASNLAEIFYAQVPTVLPLSPDDNYDTGTPGDWYRRVRTVMMHEVKHIVSFAERLSRGQIPSASFNSADRWLEESSAMLAEELWGRTIFGYQAESNVTYQQSIYCEARPFGSAQCPLPAKPLNIFDHFILLYSYLSAPETLSPIGPANTSDFTFYGSGWSFLRWLVDHHATTESGFLQAMTQEFALPGVQNIEARTGRLFADLVNEWSVALIMDDYPNFTASNLRHTMPSWNSRDVFAGMNADFMGFFTRPYPAQPHAVGFGSFAVDVNGVRGGSMSIFEVTGTQNAAQLFEVGGLNGTNLSADMRVNIIRVE